MPHGSRIADGNISPVTFVSLSTSTRGRVVQTTSGGQVYGISGQGTRYVAYGALDDGFHAIQGENCEVFTMPDTEVMLRLGGTVTQGDRLKSDSSGRGVTSSADGDEYGAIALDNGTIDQVIPVKIVGPAMRGA